jgi:hypothetical protein
MRFIALALVFACAPETPAPSISGVTPDWGYNGQTTPIRIAGEHFVPEVRASVNRGTDDPGTFRAWLTLDGQDPVPLQGVEFESLSVLTATVPAGFDAGTYDISIETPHGAVASSADRFRVSDSLADAVQVSVDRVLSPIRTQVRAEIRLLDPAGEPVELDLEVEARFLRSGTEDPAEVEILSQGELDEPLEDAVGRRGRLGADGVAELYFNGLVPDDVTLDVAVVPSSADDGVLATGVQGDSVDLVFTSGSERRLEFVLPSDPSPFEVVAGEEFLVVAQVVDDFGVLVADEDYEIAVIDSCTGAFEPLTIVGTASFFFTHTLATGSTSCPEVKLSVRGVINGDSDSYAVLPAEVDRLLVERIFPDTVTAGSSVSITAQPVDQFDNEITLHAGVVDEVLSDAGLTDVNCTSDGKVTACTATVTQAGTGFVIDVSDSLGVSGSSASFDVVAGAPRVLFGSADATWVAGEATLVSVRAEDAFGNPTDAQVLDAAGFTFTAPEDAPDCMLQDADPTDDVLDFVCTLTHATDAAELTISSAGIATGATLTGFAVDNGPVADISISTPDSPVVAGDPIQLDVVTADAYGNPYLVQTEDSVRIFDERGSIASFDLAADGTAAGAISLLEAGDRLVTARVPNTGVVSDELRIDVVAGPAVALDVQVEAPWVRTEAGTIVRISAVDPYGNRDDTVGGFVTLTSLNDIVEPSTLQGVVMGNGTVRHSVTWTDGNAAERLRAVSGSLEGESDDIVVFRDCGVDGPTVDVDFGGADAGVVCTGSTGEATTSVSLANSTAAPDNAIIAYGFEVEGAGAGVGAQSTQSVVVDGVGVYPARALVVQGDGCGQIAETRVFVGQDNGRPVGPLDVEISPTPLVVGPSAPLVDVTITGTTCSNQPAADSTVFLRTDRGVLDGVSSSGFGLVTTLGSTGSSTVQLDFSQEAQGGTTTVRAWTASGLAGGADALTTAGDAVPPTVWLQFPRGALDSPLRNSVVLVFSEPLDPSTVGLDSFTLVGAAGESFTTLLHDGNRVELDATTSFSGTPITPWLVDVDATVTDLAGNALAGTWGASGVPYRGVFGGTAGVDPVDFCDDTTSTFRPDGDDGSGIEADAVTFDFGSNSAPAWWVLTVRDVEGEIVRLDVLNQTQATDSWTWDGRDSTGQIVEAGTYTVSIEAEGPDGERDRCERFIDVEHAEVP